MLLTSRAPIGYVAIAKTPLATNQGFRNLIPKPGFDSDFLYYWLRAHDEELQRHASGSTFQELTGSALAQIRIRLPLLAEQRAIAHILGTLDDKIELNRRMNETLEEMARAIFKDWFVDFGPTRAKMEGRAPYLSSDIWSLFPDRLVDSELGEIPEGWKIVPLASLIEVNPPEQLKRGMPAPYLNMASIPTTGPNPEPYVVREFSGSGVRFRNGDALLARITPCLENGKSAFVQNLPEDQVGWGSTEFIVLRSRPPLPKAVAYLIARDPAFRANAIRSMTGTSGRQRVSSDAIAAYPLPQPESDTLWSHLNNLIAPMFERIAANGRENQTLVATRDLLLPKLISGELRVKDAERFLRERGL